MPAEADFSHTTRTLMGAPCRKRIYPDID
ncbi:hypothetical protein DESC_810109 [Desulfosarcina cetonica]|nr:hypothetical protein DESC_810109 [Desulfosarcina cetonica]